MAPGNNLLDADTATLEGSRGHWAPWFSTGIARSTTAAHSGGASLEVDVTAPFGWGVNLDNHPGFGASPGVHIFSFWATAPADPALDVTMTATWRDADGNPLGADRATLPLGPDWRQAGGVSVAPPGTVRVTVEFSSSQSGPGDIAFLDDVVVTPTTNALDAATSSLEGSVGQWIPWFSANVARSTAQARHGEASLHVDVTAPFGWGVHLNEYPGVPTGPGPKSIVFSALAADSAPGAATMTATFLGADAHVLATSSLVVDLQPAWSTGVAQVAAPAGTAYVDVVFSHSSGVAGDALYLDDIFVVDGDVPAPTVPAIPGNLLDAATATLEASSGHWAPWFSSSASRSTAEAHWGGASLRVGVEAGFGWGVTLDNHPGFAAAPGAHALSFWGLQPAGTGLAVTMAVTWRDGAGAPLATDAVDLTLGDVWRQGVGVGIAPPGTVRMTVDFLHATGARGDVLYLDDVVVAPATNALDAATATIESSAGHWAPWFSATAVRSTAQAHSGGASLEITVTDPNGWGVALNNHPGFAAALGPHVMGFSAIAPSDSGPPVTMTVTWRDWSGTPLQADTLTLAPTASWSSAGATVLAPPGANRVTVEFSNAAGGPGDRVYIDDVGVLA